MGHADDMRILSGINCTLASTNTFLRQRAAGVDPGYATMNLFGNITNGLARNEIAYEMEKYGDPRGNMINLYAGYGNPTANYIGTMGLMGAYSRCPHMFFNSYSYCCPPPPIGGYYSSPMAGMVGTMGFMGAYSSCPHMFFNSYSCCPPPPMNSFAASMGMGYGIGYGLGSIMC